VVVDAYRTTGSKAGRNASNLLSFKDKLPRVEIFSPDGSLESLHGRGKARDLDLSQFGTLENSRYWQTGNLSAID
jgi:hypothetical protein